MKKVSIIIPTLNKKTYKKCIESLINNDYENKEITVTNGMSLDNIRKILK